LKRSRCGRGLKNGLRARCRAQQRDCSQNRRYSPRPRNDSHCDRMLALSIRAVNSGIRKARD
jgi:hypothetical protein